MPDLLLKHRPISLDGVKYKNLLEKNLNQNLIVVADSQTAGRGRMGRSFYSPDASGLYFSLTIDLQNKNITPSQITAFSGVEVCNTIKEFFNIDSKIKWINDIFINNKNSIWKQSSALQNYHHLAKRSFTQVKKMFINIANFFYKCFFNRVYCIISFSEFWTSK